MARRGWRRGREVWAVGEGVIANSAYGVAATFLPQKGGAVPESEKRRAAWCTTSTSHTYFVPLLPRAVPSSHLLPTLLVALNGWASCGGHDPLLTVACTAPRRVPLSLFEVKSRIRAPSALSLVFLPRTVRPAPHHRSGTHAGEALSSCCEGGIS